MDYKLKKFNSKGNFLWLSEGLLLAGLILSVAGVGIKLWIKGNSQ